MNKYICALKIYNIYFEFLLSYLLSNQCSNPRKKVIIKKM